MKTLFFLILTLPVSAFSQNVLTAMYDSLRCDSFVSYSKDKFTADETWIGGDGAVILMYYKKIGSVLGDPAINVEFEVEDAIFGKGLYLLFTDPLTNKPVNLNLPYVQVKTKVRDDKMYAHATAILPIDWNFAKFESYLLTDIRLHSSDFIVSPEESSKHRSLGFCMSYIALTK
jgi:hypothetical protein